MHDGKSSDRCRPCAPARTPGLCFLAAAVLTAGCAVSSDEADARKMLAKTVAAMEERGMSFVPVESDAGEMIARHHAADWIPFGQAGDLERFAASVGMEDGGGRGSGEAVLVIKLKPEAAKELLRRRLGAELAAVREENAALLTDGEDAEEGGSADLSRRISERIAAAERELDDMIAAADVETVIRLRVDRISAAPADLRMETRIVRPAEELSAAGEAAGSADGNEEAKQTGRTAKAGQTGETGGNGGTAGVRGGRGGPGAGAAANGDGEPPVLQETMSDTFKITTTMSDRRG